jgi:hypothetical protein
MEGPWIVRLSPALNVREGEVSRDEELEPRGLAIPRDKVATELL